MTTALTSSATSTQLQRRPEHPIIQAILKENRSSISLHKTSAESVSSQSYKAQTSTNSQSSQQNDNGHGTPPSSSVTKRSSKIQKITQTLSWRSAHVHSSKYSLTIQAPPSSSAPSPIPQTICVRQVQTDSDAYGTGATVWPASLVLVKYLEWTQEKWLDSPSGGHCGGGDGARRWRKTVVDLGAGTGVTSLGVALMLSNNLSPMLEDQIGESRGGGGKYEQLSSLVVCTDGCGLVVKLAEENVQSVLQDLVSSSHGDFATDILSDKKDIERIETNTGATSNVVEHMMGSCEIRVREYNWGDGTLHKEIASIESSDNKADNTTKKNQHFDIILVSDCVLPKLYPIAPLVDALDELSGPDTIAYISYEERYYPEYDPKEYFRNLAEAKGFDVKQVPLEEQHPIYSVEDIEIWEVRRRK